MVFEYFLLNSITFPVFLTILLEYFSTIFANSSDFRYNTPMKTKNRIKNVVMSTFVLIVLLYSMDAEVSTKALSGDLETIVIL